MPINAGYEFGLAEEEFHNAQSTEEKVKALQKMLSTAPAHKGSEKLREEIKRKLAKFREQLKKEKSKKGGGGGISIKQEGDACICLVGVTNSGRSTLLMELTGARPKISEHEFTTQKPEVGIMDCYGVQVQVIELPAIVKNYYNTEDGPSFLGIMRTSDVVVIVVDMMKNVGEQIRLVREELDKNAIRVKTVIIGLKGEVGLSADEARKRIWDSLGLIRVYTKSKSEKKKDTPVALPAGSSVRTFATRIHKDFIKKLRYARVWGKGAKFEGQQVGLNHILKDGDRVELFEKK